MSLEPRYLRKMIMRVACRHGEMYCVANATALFHQWMDNPSVNKYVREDMTKTLVL